MRPHRPSDSRPSDSRPSADRPSRSRRSALLAGAGALLGLGAGLAGAPTAGAAAAGRPFGPHGSPVRRRDERTLYVDPLGRGDHTTVQAAVNAAGADGWTLVLAPAVYRETVLVPQDRTGLTLLGAAADPRRAVIVYDNAAGTPKPGGGTYGTSGSATTTVHAAGFTARRVTFANDWLRADHPEITGTQAVALKATGDRSAFLDCRFLGHQDTLYADSPALAVFARQYFLRCHVEGDVDFVFGRATAVFDRCRFHTLDRRDLAAAPYGFVCAPSTAAANPFGLLVTRSRVTGEAPDAHYRLARPWVPGSDTTARPMLTVRDTWIGPGIDAVAPYTNMREQYPWQSMRFREYGNTGPGSVVHVPENRPQLTAEEAGSHTAATHLGDWTPGRS